MLVINLKKWIIIVFLVSLFYLLAERKNNVLYMNDTFRFRIIANSNSVEDQALKNKIKKDIVTNVFQKMDFNSSSSVKNEIKNNLPLISNIVSQYNIKYNISFGKNYFPEKSSSFIPIGYYSIKYCPGKALENRGREEKGIKFSKVDGKEKMCYTN